MKKMLALALAAILAVSMTACKAGGEVAVHSGDTAFFRVGEWFVCTEERGAHRLPLPFYDVKSAARRK